MNLKGTKTEKNLMEAFAGESQARNKYTYYASKAKKEGYRSDNRDKSPDRRADRHPAPSGGGKSRHREKRAHAPAGRHADRLLAGDQRLARLAHP